MNLFLSADGRLRPNWRFALGLLLAFIAYSFAAGVAMAFAPAGSLAFDVIFRAIWAACLLAEFSGVLLLVDGASSPLFAMGLGRPWKRNTVLGLLIGAGMVVIAAACIAVGADLDFHVIFTKSTGPALILVALVVVAGALAEELVFRGYPFQRLVESVGRWPAVVIVAGLFGTVHLLNPHASVVGFLNTALIGALLCLAYLRTWTLWLPLGIHAGWNAMLGIVLGLPVSGVTEFSVIVHGNTYGANWLTGGSYGMEAGASGTFAIVLGFLALKAFVPQAALPSATQAATQTLALGTAPEEVAAPSSETESSDLEH